MFDTDFEGHGPSRREAGAPLVGPAGGAQPGRLGKALGCGSGSTEQQEWSWRSGSYPRGSRTALRPSVATGSAVAFRWKQLPILSHPFASQFLGMAFLHGADFSDGLSPSSL